MGLEDVGEARFSQGAVIFFGVGEVSPCVAFCAAYGGRRGRHSRAASAYPGRRTG